MYVIVALVFDSCHFEYGSLEENIHNKICILLKGICAKIIY
jgi:hypothetical protein